MGPVRGVGGRDRGSTKLYAGASFFCRWRLTKRFYHCRRDRIDRQRRVVSLLRIVVPEYRKHQVFSANRGGIAGKRVDMIGRARFCLDEPCCTRVFHAVLQRAVHSRDRKSGEEILSPWLRDRVTQ